MDLIFDLLIREKKRMIMCLIKDETILKQLIPALNKVTDTNLRDLIQRYYTQCSHKHNVAFAEWRMQTKKLKDEGYSDINNGYYYPYLKIRTIQELESVNFKLPWTESQLSLL